MTKATTKSLELRFNVRDIATTTVMGVVSAYQYFYRPDESCICKEVDGKWPNLFRDGNSVVCYHHEWHAKRKRLQASAIGSGLSLPLPVYPPQVSVDSSLNAVKNHFGDLEKNPLRVIKHPLTLKPNRKSGDLATALAARLQYEHVVFLVHRSQAINLIFGQKEQEVQDVLAYAPVLVFWDNADKRENGRIRSLVGLRQYGYAIIVE